jgi:hypothetical protein
MNAEPAILLDVSRLISRLGTGPLTGIDRVEAEWLAHMQTARICCCAASRAGSCCCRPRRGAAILRWIAGDLTGLPRARLADRLAPGRRGAPARAMAALRRMALPARARRARHARRGAPAPACRAAYLNVGHANLDRALWQNLRGLRRVVLIHDTIPLDHPEFTRAGTVRRNSAPAS